MPYVQTTISLFKNLYLFQRTCICFKQIARDYTLHITFSVMFNKFLIVSGKSFKCTETEFASG